MGIFNSDRRTTSGSATSTLIAKGCSVSGEIKVESDIQIDGFVNGQLHINGTLTIADSGRVQGDIFAKQLIVNGLLEGTCHAVQVQILPKGCVKGRLWSNSLSIEPGGRFFGEAAELPETEVAALKTKKQGNETNEPKETARKSA